MTKRVQQTMADLVPELDPAVAAAAEKYLDPKRKIANLREKMNAGKDELIAAMKMAGVSEILIDDGEKKLILEEHDAIKIEARKKITANE